MWFLGVLGVILFLGLCATSILGARGDKIKRRLGQLVQFCIACDNGSPTYDFGQYLRFRMVRITPIKAIPLNGDVYPP